jgi:hypothetical protein
MSIRELAAEDGAKILGDETDIVLTSPDVVPVTYNIHGLVKATGAHSDADSILVVGDQCVVTISTVELAAAGLSDPNALKSKNWSIVTTDVHGTAISGKVGVVLVDATLGRVTLFIKEDD